MFASYIIIDGIGIPVASVKGPVSVVWLTPEQKYPFLPDKIFWCIFFKGNVYKCYKFRGVFPGSLLQAWIDFNPKMDN